MKLFRIALLTASGIAATVALSSAADGKAIFLDKKCNTCHSIDSQGVAKTSDKIKAPDLSNAGGMIQSADWAKSFLTKQVEKDGKKHLREWKGTDEELNTVVQWLVSLKKS
jgi:cytochrome c551/c552